MLTVIGPATYKLLSNLVAPKKAGEVEYSTPVKTLADHFNPTPSEIVQRFKFNSRSRKLGESVATFVAELRAIATTCNFGETLEAMLRDRIVCGVNDNAIQKRLLAEPKLTFQQALDLARGLKTAARNIKELKTPHGPDAASKTEDVQKISSGRAYGRVTSSSNLRPEITCFRCGKPGHYATKCKVSRLVVCHKCNRRGHLKKACKGAGNRRAETPSHPVRRVCEDTEQGEVPIFHVQMSERTPAYKVTVEADGYSLALEVDTGSSVSLVSQSVFEQLWPNRELSHCQYKLRSYANEPIKVLGCFECNVQYKSQAVQLPLIMVEGKGPTLLGRSWLKHLQLDWHEIKHVTSDSLQALLQKYEKVFQEGLGTLKNFQAKIHVDPTASPKFCKARTVPYTMRGKVEEELERLVQEGTLKPVQLADWAAPIVPVLKQDRSSIHICSDFRQTANPVAKLDRYPIPKVEDLLVTLVKGKSFTKMDLSHVYQQLLLDETSKQYVVINIHRSLFRYTRLPFGISLAPGIFQRVIDSEINGIPGMVTYLDDILITGLTNEAHLQALEGVVTSGGCWSPGKEREM